MWNLQSCSKIIQQRTQQKNYQMHRKKLKSMQPRMRIQEPVQPDFVYSKPKLNMSRKDRRVEIDRLNCILLNKMEIIRLADYNTNKLRPQAQNLKTMNAHTIQVSNKQIAKQNKRFCQKLLRTQSYYPTSNILQKTDHLEYVGSNISFNARRCMSAKSFSRPKSGYSTAFSSAQKRLNVESQRPLSGVDGKRVDVYSARPQTAPMFSRSSEKRIVIPEKGNPKVEDHENQERQ